MTKGKMKNIWFLFSYTHKSADKVKDKAYHISYNILYLQISQLDITMLKVRLQGPHTGQGQLNYNLKTLWKHSKHLIKQRSWFPLFSLLINYFSLTVKQCRWDQLFLNTTNTRNEKNTRHVHTLLLNSVLFQVLKLQPLYTSLETF